MSEIKRYDAAFSYGNEHGPYVTYEAHMAKVQELESKAKRNYDFASQQSNLLTDESYSLREKYLKIQELQSTVDSLKTENRSLRTESSNLQAKLDKALERFKLLEQLPHDEDCDARLPILFGEDSDCTCFKDVVVMAIAEINKG